MGYIINADKVTIGGRYKENAANQDSVYLPRKNNCQIGIISDGMGGKKGGEIASKIVATSLGSKLESALERWLINEADINKEFLEQLNEVNQEVMQDANAGGATVDAFVKIKDCVYFGHAGDSEILVFRNGVLDKITKDDNSTAELMEKGVLLAEEKHLLNTPAFLTQYVGKEKCQFSVGRFELDKTKYMFLVTDGFKDRVIREEMQEIALKYDSLSEVMCELEKIMKNPEKMAKKVRELAKSKDPLYVLSLNTVKEDLLRDDATVVGMQILEVIENDR